MNNESTFLGLNFAHLVSLTYLILKIVFKLGIHKLIQHDKPINNWPTYVWSTVDLSMLGIAISFVAKVPSKCFNETDIALVWFCFLAMCLFCTLVSYGLYMKRVESGSTKKFSKLKQVANITAASLFGVGPFIIIFKELLP